MENQIQYVELASLVVFSEYFFPKTEIKRVWSKWFYQESDLIPIPNSVIGQMYTEFNEESKASEVKDVKTPFTGKIQILSEKIDLSSKKCLLMRIQLCEHSALEVQTNCPFCLQNPEKLNDNLEKEFFFKGKLNLRLYKIKGSVSRIYSKIDEILLLSSEDNTILKVIPPFGGTLSWLPDFSGPINQGAPLFAIKPCKHTEVFNDLCTGCSETVLGVKISNHHEHLLIKDVKITCEEGKKKYAEKEKQSLLDKGKLILILDLDNTLIHAIKSDIKTPINPDEADVYEWILNPAEKFLIKLRPFLLEFFLTVQPIYEIFLYTMGTRSYAEFIRCLLNENKGGRIAEEKTIALEDNFNLAEKKIKRIVPYSNDMVLLLDDRGDVWPDDRENLVLTKPYQYYREKPEANQRKSDCYLYFASRTLKRIHEIFFRLQKLGKIPDVRTIKIWMLTKLLKGKKLCFSGVVQKNSGLSFHNNKYVRFCEFSGAEVLEEMEGDKLPDLLIVREFIKTHKVSLALKKNIPIVHFLWLDYSRLFSTMINWESFVLNDERKQINEMWDIEKDLVEKNEAFLKEYEEKLIENTMEKILE